MHNKALLQNPRFARLRKARVLMTAKGTFPPLASQF